MEAGTLPTRADAVRNRERVVAAAVALFAERGIEASVPEVAARAGVGKATVYRSFPTKGDLIAAVVLDWLGAFERRARDQLDAPDAWVALRDLLAESAFKQSADHTLSCALAADVASELLGEARRRMWGAVQELMDRAKAQGTMRADATAADLRVLWAGSARMLAADGVQDPAEWRRYAGLVLDALRPA